MKIPRRFFQPIVILSAIVAVAVPAAFASNGTIEYIDFNAANAGFGSTNSGAVINMTNLPVGTAPQYWTTDPTGSSTPANFPSGNQMTFGDTANQVTGTFTVNLNGGQNLNGVCVSNSGASITLTGTQNTHATSANTWYVASGSTLILNNSRQGFDAGSTSSLKSFNFNSQALTISGGGTMTFTSPVGNNSSALVTENMSSGGMVNFNMGSAAPSGTGTYSGGYKLQAGTLNFASAGSVNQFYGFTSGKNFEIDGSTTIDNTSGSALGPLNWSGGGGINIAGSFTFTGSSSLDLGTAPVTLSSSAITVSASKLAIGGIISGSSSTLTTAGNGTLMLGGVNSYGGNTTIGAGSTLLVSSSGSLNSGSAVSVNGALGGAGTINGSVTAASGSQINQESNYLVTAAVATLTLANGLDMSAGGACYLDLGTTYNSGNDQISVTGASVKLSASGQTIFHLKWLGTGAQNLDTTGDYVLIAGGSAPSGTVNSAPVWDGTAPANSASFVVKISGNNVVLHNAASTAFSIVTAVASPASASRYQSSLLSVNVTNGTAPYTVTVDASSVGGSASLGLVQDASQPAGIYTYTNSVMPSAGASLGAHSLPVTASDSASATANGSISLTVVGASLTWNGDASGNSFWDTAGEAEWQGGLTYQQGDFVTFDDSATGVNATNVNLVTTLTPGSLTVNNTAGGATADYAFIGSGKISGGTGLAKQGTGTLIIDNSTANDFSGTVTISAGTLQIGNNDANGNLPSVSVNDNSSLVFNRTADLIVAAMISGSGSVSQINSDTISLNGANGYNGATMISSGTIKVNNNASLGTVPGGAVTISGGGTLDIGGNGMANNANYGAKQFNVSGTGVGGNGVIVNSGAVSQQNAFEAITLTANATFGGASRWDIRGGTPVLDLAGFTLTKTGPNQISCVSPHVTSGNIIINQGVLSFESTPNFDASAGTITVNGGAFVGQFKDTAGSFTRGIVLNGGGITNLSGSSTCFLDSTILLTANSLMGSSGGTETFNGIISDGGNHFGLAKFGNGTNLLAAANTYGGNTVINGGILGLTGSGSIANSANIIVAGGTTFDVSGLSAAFVLGGSQTLSNSTSTARFAGNVSTGLGTISLTYASGTPSFTVTNGTLTLSSSTVFDVNNTGSSLASGFYKIISAAATGNIGAVGGTVPAVGVSGGGIAAGQHASLSISANELYLVVSNQAPVIANIVTNNVPIGSTWKIKISDLRTAAGWSDPDGDPVTFNGVNSPSANGTNITSDATYIYYNGAVTGQDSLTYTVTDGYLTTTGTVYLEAIPATLPPIANPTLDGNGHPTFSGSGIPGYVLGVEYATSINGPWANAGTTTVNGTGSWTFTDTNQTNPGTIFYRLYYPYNPSNPPQ